MPRKITETCVACGACASVCPVSCIKEGEIYVIKQDECIDCGVCESECPTESIISE